VNVNEANFTGYVVLMY